MDRLDYVCQGKGHQGFDNASHLVGRDSLEALDLSSKFSGEDIPADHGG